MALSSPQLEIDSEASQHEVQNKEKKHMKLAQSKDTAEQGLYGTIAKIIYTQIESQKAQETTEKEFVHIHLSNIKTELTSALSHVSPDNYLSDQEINNILVQFSVLSPDSKSAIRVMILELQLTIRIETAQKTFKNSILMATQQGNLSEKEGSSWMAGFQIPAEMPKTEVCQMIEEMHHYLKINIEINTKKQQLAIHMEKAIDESGIFALKEKQVWMEKIQEIQGKYADGKIFLQASLDQMMALSESLPAMLKRDRNPREEYKALLTSIEGYKHNLPGKVSKGFHSVDDFNKLSFEEQIKYLKECNETLENAFTAFSKQYNQYCEIVSANKKWNACISIPQKIRFLGRLEKNMNQNTDKFTNQKNEIQNFIRFKRYNVALQKLLHFEKTIHPETYAFFNFDEMEHSIRTKLLERSRLIEMGTSVSHTHPEGALEFFYKAHSIEADLSIDTLIAETKERAEAKAVYEEALLKLSKGEHETYKRLKQEALGKWNGVSELETFQNREKQLALQQEEKKQEELKTKIQGDPKVQILDTQIHIIRKILEVQEEGKQTSRLEEKSHQTAENRVKQEKGEKEQSVEVQKLEEVTIGKKQSFIDIETDKTQENILPSIRQVQVGIRTQLISTEQIRFVNEEQQEQSNLKSLKVTLEAKKQMHIQKHKKNLLEIAA